MRHRKLHLVGAAILLIASWRTGGPAWAQSAPESQETGADAASLRLTLEQIRREISEMRAELRRMRALLLQQLGQAPPARSGAPIVVTVAVGDNPTLGKPDAPLTLVEFSDYQCPFCRQFSEGTLPALRKDYIDTGKLRYAFRDFPIAQIHPLARKAAEAARCAGDEGKYWDMHDLLFRNQRALRAEQFQAYAEQLHLDARAFGTCLENAKYQAHVQRDFVEGVSAGVRGTPAFVLGRTGADGTVEGILISGLRSLDDFQQEMERLLTQKGEK